MIAALSKVNYLLRETLSGLQRGGWMNWAAISTVMVLLFLFGVCVQTSWQLDSLLDHFGSQLEISVYLEPEAPAAELEVAIAQLPHIESIRFVSKDVAWKTLLQELGVADVEAATQQLEGNPLVDEFKITATNVQEIPGLLSQITQLAGIDRAIYINEVIERFRQIQQSLNGVALGVTLALSLTAIAVITTTLNLIAIARRNELEIMQLVGATRTWIILPFVLHGIIFGAAGAGLAIALITALRVAIAEVLATQTEFLAFVLESLVLSPTQTVLLPIVVGTLGILIGTIGSLFAIRQVLAR